MVSKNAQNPQDRFYGKVKYDPDSGCHLWSGTCFENGYGKFWLSGKSVKAHRAAWVFHNVEIPHGMCVLHKCDTPACVNPNHLFIGTNKDNTADMLAKGRHGRGAPRGEAQNKAKLRASDIPTIRKDGRKNREIAKCFGVTEATISGVKTGRYWSHIQW